MDILQENTLVFYSNFDYFYTLVKFWVVYNNNIYNTNKWFYLTHNNVLKIILYNRDLISKKLNYKSSS